MNRKIYKFYCYCCNTLNINNQSYSLEIKDNKIEHIFCPKCCTWIHYSNTNLSANRYKIVRKSKWIIIDEDSLNWLPVYTSENHTLINEVCTNLNNNMISLETLNGKIPIWDAVEWYLSHF